jgi:uncharacterized membrane protein
MEHHRARTPIRRKVGASIVLLIAAALAISLVVSFVKAIFVTVLVIVAVIGVLWALKTLFW